MVECARCWDWFHFRCVSYDNTPTKDYVEYVCTTCSDVSTTPSNKIYTKGLMTTHDVVVQSTLKSNVKDKPDAMTHIQCKPNVISDIIDEPNVISDIIDESSVISDIITEHSVISEGLHKTEMESEIPHKQRITLTLSYKPITDTVNRIIPINKLLDEPHSRLEEEVIRSLNTSLSLTEGSIIKNEYTTELSPLSLPPNHVSTDVRCPPENEQRTWISLKYATMQDDKKLAGNITDSDCTSKN